MKVKVVIALVLGVVVGAGGMFGYFYSREMQRYRAYQKHMADKPEESDLSLFNLEQLSQLELTDPSGGRGPSIREGSI